MRAPPEHDTIGFQRTLDGARDLFTDDGAHRAANETVLHRRKNNWKLLDRALHIHHSLEDTDSLRQRFESIFIWLRRLEFERICGVQRPIALGPSAIHKQINPLIRRNFVVVAALRTNLKIALEVFFPEWFFAAAAFDPKTLRDDTFLVHGLHRSLLAFKPCHKEAYLSRR